MCGLLFFIYLWCITSEHRIVSFQILKNTEMRLLLISNSTNAGEEYLDYPKNNIREFLGSKKIQALFIPYAAVTFSFDEYEEKVRARFREVGHDVVSIHHFSDPVSYTHLTLPTNREV